MEEYIGRIKQLTQAPLHLRKKVCEEMKHGIQVSNLAVMVAKELGKEEAFCRDIATTGILHDIGKLKLTKYLNGEDGLMIEHMKYVRQHTAQSYEIMMGAGYDTELSLAVYHHHENFDGSGYPGNLRGEEIPLMARILRVCDVFAALTMNRNYRKAFDAKTAMEIMIDEVPDYDMEVFLAFQRVVHNKEDREAFEQKMHEISKEQEEALGLFEKELLLLL